MYKILCHTTVKNKLSSKFPPHVLPTPPYLTVFHTEIKITYKIIIYITTIGYSHNLVAQIKVNCYSMRNCINCKQYILK